MEHMHDHINFAKSLWEEGHAHDRIILELSRRGLQNELIDEVLEHLKKFRYAKRRNRGMNLLAVGCVCLLLGFLCTLFVSYSDVTFQYSLYGFTLIGITLVIIGVADIMG